MMDDYGAEIMGVRDDSYEAQIVRLNTYLAASMPDFIWKDGSTADVAIAALIQLSAEVERLRQWEFVISNPAFDRKELGYAGL
jgi:hypothetical protein